MPDAEKSRVNYRKLDEEAWHVVYYDDETGDNTIVRGNNYSLFHKFDDQFSSNENVEKVRIEVEVHIRNPFIRWLALSRANGRCEYCGAIGFEKLNGKIYLETHHIVPLCEKGRDAVDNVIALCANHHREAHYGLNAMSLREKFMSILATA